MLTEEIAGGPSLGDVFRTTCILQEFSGDDVTWVTAESALPLLPGAPLVNRALIYSTSTLSLLSTESFDCIINLERCPDICAWLENYIAISHPKLVLGFSPAAVNGSNGIKRNGSISSTNANGYYPLSRTLDLKELQTHIHELAKPYQYFVFKAIGKTWHDQRYTLPQGISLSNVPTIAVGFNHAVGPKWPVKSWPEFYWKELAKLCESSGITYSFQEGFDNLGEYMHWILKHQIIVSSDSLGLHLSVAFKRWTIGLFGPTRANDIHFYDSGEALSAHTPCPKVPCFQHECDFKEHCMNSITPEQVFARISAAIEAPQTRHLAQQT